MGLILLTIILGISMITIEKAWPNSELPDTPLWWLRAIGFNLAQVLISFAGIYTWDRWLPNLKLFDISSWSLGLQVLVAYLTITFIYYWWHRARHEIPLLWNCLHQIHHSPARLEIITSFYKHPLEIILNGLLSSWILYSLLGVSPSVAAVVVCLTGIAEFIYHWNISTPHWLGYLFQRPESHRLHHEYGTHQYNFSDLPIWDMLFGTFNNPKTCPNKTGFDEEQEIQVFKMLLGKPV